MAAVTLTPDRDHEHLAHVYPDAPENDVRQRHRYRVTGEAHGRTYTVYGETPREAERNLDARLKQAREKREQRQSQQ